MKNYNEKDKVKAVVEAQVKSDNFPRNISTAQLIPGCQANKSDLPNSGAHNGNMLAVETVPPDNGSGYRPQFGRHQFWDVARLPPQV